MIPNQDYISAALPTGCAALLFSPLFRAFSIFLAPDVDESPKLCYNNKGLTKELQSRGRCNLLEISPGKGIVI